MKRLKYIMIAALGAAFITSCTKDEQVRVDPDKIVAASFIDLPTQAIVLNKEDADLNCDSIKWTKAEFGYNAAVNYTLQARKQGSETFTTLGTVAGLTGWSDKTSIFNNALIKMRCEPNVENVIEIMVTASIAASYKPVGSQIATIKVVSFDSAIEYPALWMIGSYCGWSFDNAQNLYSISDNGIYTGWIDLTDPNGFKFTTVPDWDNGTNYGGSLEALDRDPGAGNINAAAAGYFYFEVNTRTLSAEIKYEVITLGLIGDATPNGWDGQTNLSYEANSQLWKGTFTMRDGGKFKVRINDDWGIAFGEGESEGQLGSGGDISFNMPSGVYEVQIDMSKATPTYEFIAK